MRAESRKIEARPFFVHHRRSLEHGFCSARAARVRRGLVSECRSIDSTSTGRVVIPATPKPGTLREAELAGAAQAQPGGQR
jgi:hypothetical protein